MITDAFNTIKNKQKHGAIMNVTQRDKINRNTILDSYQGLQINHQRNHSDWRA